MSEEDYFKNIQSLSAKVPVSPINAMTTNTISTNTTASVNATSAAINPVMTNGNATNTRIPLSRPGQELLEKEKGHHKKKKKERMSAIASTDTLTPTLNPPTHPTRRSMQENASAMIFTTDTTLTTITESLSLIRSLPVEQQQFRTLQSSLLCRYAYEGKGKAWCLVQCDGNHFRL